MFEQYGIQQIESIYIKAKDKIKIDNKWFGPNEVILYLTDVEAGKLTEEKNIQSAEGGSNNSRLVEWLTHKNVNFLISKGVLSKRDFNYLLDSNIVYKENVVITQREIHTTSEDGYIRLNHQPLPGIFCYDIQGNKISVILEGQEIFVGEEYSEQEIITDYSFYVEDAYGYSIKRNFLSNIIINAEIHFLLKDENDGQEYFGILTIPSAVIVGDINLIMGKKATPIVGNFVIQSVQSKTESREERSNYNLIILNKDITDF